MGVAASTTATITAGILHTTENDDDDDDGDVDAPLPEATISIKRARPIDWVDDDDEGARLHAYSINAGEVASTLELQVNFDGQVIGLFNGPSDLLID